MATFEEVEFKLANGRKIAGKATGPVDGELWCLRLLSSQKSV